MLFSALVLRSDVALSAPSTSQVRRVLYINSYHPGYSWSDGIEQGIRSQLSKAPDPIEVSVEYLDSRRFPNPVLLEEMAAHFATKYAQYKQDLVIVSDNTAFDFAIAHRKQLFPYLPIVFCGYNNFRPELLTGIPNVTGINEEIDIPATIDMALGVHPQTRTLVFVTSTDDASSKRIAEIAETTVFPKYRARFEVIVLKDASMAQIRSQIGGLSPNSIVFLSGQTSDTGRGRSLSPVENGYLISAVSPVPVYTFWDFHLGTGVLGGHILAAADQGRDAANLALRILDGTPADQIPVVVTSPTTDIFDYPVMKRFHVTDLDLPPRSVVINRPVSLWEQYRRRFVGAGFVLLAQSALIAALLWAIRQRRRAQLALETEREQLEKRVIERTRELREALAARNTLLDNALVTIVLIRALRFVWASSHIIEMLGYSPEEVIGLTTDFIYATPEHAQKIANEAPEVLARGQSYQAECCFRRKDGSLLWCIICGKALDPADITKGVLFVVADIDAQKRTEQALQEANKRLEILATTDILTGIANRRHLLHVLELETARSDRYESKLSVIMIDIDHFKPVNDRYGHDVGDDLLRKISELLCSTSRKVDTVGRWGGEEFLIVCPETDLVGALALAELLRERIEEHDFGTPHHVTASFGVDEYIPGQGVSQLTKRADNALYRAKRSRNCVSQIPRENAPTTG